MDLPELPTVYSSGTVQKDLREFFRAERKRLELTQADVAADSGGVDQGTISKIERDAPYEPSVIVFLRAIKGLGMTPSEFFARFEHESSAAAKRDRSGHSELQLSSLNAPAQSLTTPPRTVDIDRGTHAQGASLRLTRLSPDLLFELGTLLLNAAADAETQRAAPAVDEQSPSTGTHGAAPVPRHSSRRRKHGR